MKRYYKTLYKPLLGLVGVLSMATAFGSCDNHQPIDPDLHVGYVLCDDHTCMDTASYFKQSQRKAVGVVFAEKTEDHPALVVNLKETSGVFCDSLGMANGTSGDITKYDGFTNTVAMYQSYDSESGHGSPIAMKMMYYHEFGQSDHIPSVAEQRLLQSAARVINPIIKKCEGDTVSLSSNCWYWTSTEVSENSGTQAWLCSAVNGGIMPTPKIESHKVRAILEIYYPE